MSNLSDFCSSASSNSVTVEYWKLKDDYVIHGKVLGVFFLLYELLGLPGNILVVITIIKEKLYHQPTIILLLNLLVADLFILAYPLPMLMASGFAGEFIIGSSDRIRCETCHLGFAFVTPLYSSFVIIALMSLDRFLYIYKPFQYEHANTKYIAIVAVLVAVLVSIALGLVAQLAPGRPYFNPSLLMCSITVSDSSLWYPILLIAIGIVVFASIIISNGWFSCIVLKNIRAVYPSQNKSHWYLLKKRVESPRYQKQNRLYFMFCSLLLSSLMTWIPLMVISVGFLISPSFSLLLELTTIAQILQHSQLVLHPILETMLLVDIRNPLVNMVTCGLFKRKKNELAVKEDRHFCCTPHTGERGHCCFLVTVIEVACLPQNEVADLQAENIS